MMTRRAAAFAFAAGVIPLLVTLAGCGSEKSTASRSAAAYDEAQRKGIAVGESAHGSEGGHGAGAHAAEPSPQDGTVSSAMPGMDHSSMAGMKPGGQGTTEPRPRAGMSHPGMPGMGAQSQVRTDAHAGVDHSRMPGLTPPPADHSNMPGMQPAGQRAKEPDAMAGIDHSGMPGMGTQSGTQADPHAGMDHSSMPGMSHDMPMSPPSPEPLSATAEAGQPTATLQPDALDQPPPTSVADAARSAAMAAEMSGGGHGMSHGTYQHVDAGRGAEGPSPQPSPQAKEHKH